MPVDIDIIHTIRKGHDLDALEAGDPIVCVNTFGLIVHCKMGFFRNTRFSFCIQICDLDGYFLQTFS